MAVLRYRTEISHFEGSLYLDESSFFFSYLFLSEFFDVGFPRVASSWRVMLDLLFIHCPFLDVLTDRYEGDVRERLTPLKDSEREETYIRDASESDSMLSSLGWHL